MRLYGVATPDVRRIERGLYGLVRKEWRYAEAIAFYRLLMRDRHIESKSIGWMLLARYHRQYPESLPVDVKGWLAGNPCDNSAVTDQLSTQIVSVVREISEAGGDRRDLEPLSESLATTRQRSVLRQPCRQGRHRTPVELQRRK